MKKKQIIESLLNKNTIINNFSILNNWEDKYLYIINLGQSLPKMPKNLYKSIHLVSGCQNKTWVSLFTNDTTYNTYKNLCFYGDSDSLIIKGLISLIFIYYKNMTIKEIIYDDLHLFFQKLQLKQHLTFSRSQGVEKIIKKIQQQAYNIIKLSN